jgi:hypothetical protein
MDNLSLAILASFFCAIGGSAYGITETFMAFAIQRRYLFFLPPSIT